MAWTIVESISAVHPINHYQGEQMYKIKLACTSDASLTDFDLGSNTDTDSVEIARIIKGAWLYLVKFVPGAGDDAPSAAFNCDFEDAEDDHLLDTDSNSNSATTYVLGSDTIGGFPPILGTLSVVCATLGNANTADIYIYLLK